MQTMHWNSPFLFGLLETGRAAPAHLPHLLIFHKVRLCVSVYNQRQACSLDFSLIPLVSLTLLVHRTRNVVHREGFSCFMVQLLLSFRQRTDVPAVPGYGDTAHAVDVPT